MSQGGGAKRAFRTARRRSSGWAGPRGRRLPPAARDGAGVDGGRAGPPLAAGWDSPALSVMGGPRAARRWEPSQFEYLTGRRAPLAAPARPQSQVAPAGRGGGALWLLGGRPGARGPVGFAFTCAGQ